jgi:hypothetical protein
MRRRQTRHKSNGPETAGGVSAVSGPIHPAEGRGQNGASLLLHDDGCDHFGIDGAHVFECALLAELERERAVLAEGF